MTSLWYLILHSARELDLVFPFGYTSIGKVGFDTRSEQ